MIVLSQRYIHNIDTVFVNLFLYTQDTGRKRREIGITLAHLVVSHETNQTLRVLFIYRETRWNREKCTEWTKYTRRYRWASSQAGRIYIVHTLSRIEIDFTLKACVDIFICFLCFLRVVSAHRIICTENSVHLSFSILSFLFLYFFLPPLPFFPFSFLPQTHLFVLYTSFPFVSYFVTSFLHEISHLFFEFIPRDYANNLTFANRNCLDFKLDRPKFWLVYTMFFILVQLFRPCNLCEHTTCVNFNDCTRICKLHASFSEQVIFSLKKERRSCSLRY